ncbi:MAG: NAD-dependent epimerase/dehydratase family protein [Chthoniobacteraceae bacterium]|nr:NAD-dependent epimerase/dehydratase family protein [Chthoniobacteraceae bacterium]
MNPAEAGFACESAPLRGCRLLVAGCGYLGLAVARLAHATGWEVAGLTRSAASARALQGEPFRVLPCDITEASAVRALGHFDAVLHCASSGHGGAEVYRRLFEEGTRHLLEGLRPARFVFTGSTSVYAQTDGAWVTEESPAEPERETGRILRSAEDLVLAAGGVAARLAGLYGPDRWALLRKFLEGRAVLEEGGERFLNQIHRADAASALLLLLDPAVPAGIYNVADGTPVTQRELYAAFADHFGKPLPPAGPRDLSRKRGWTHKRVSNAKLCALGWRPLYPSFREALAGW